MVQEQHSDSNSRITKSNSMARAGQRALTKTNCNGLQEFDGNVSAFELFKKPHRFGRSGGQFYPGRKMAIKNNSNSNVQTQNQIARFQIKPR